MVRYQKIRFLLQVVDVIRKRIARVVQIAELRGVVADEGEVAQVYVVEQRLELFDCAMHRVPRVRMDSKSQDEVLSRAYPSFLLPR